MGRRVSIASWRPRGGWFRLGEIWLFAEQKTNVIDRRNGHKIDIIFRPHGRFNTQLNHFVRMS